MFLIARKDSTPGSKNESLQSLGISDNTRFQVRILINSQKEERHFQHLWQDI